MIRGTCSVCGREFAVRKGRLSWHKFPKSLIVHPQKHRPDHCLGVHFPPIEHSREGLVRYIGEALSLLDAMKHDPEGYRGSPEWLHRRNELNGIIDELMRKYRYWEGREYDLPR